PAPPGPAAVQFVHPSSAVKSLTSGGAVFQLRGDGSLSRSGIPIATGVSEIIVDAGDTLVAQYAAGGIAFWNGKGLEQFGLGDYCPLMFVDGRVQMYHLNVKECGFARWKGIGEGRSRGFTVLPNPGLRQLAVDGAGRLFGLNPQAQVLYRWTGSDWDKV